MDPLPPKSDAADKSRNRFGRRGFARLDKQVDQCNALHTNTLHILMVISTDRPAGTLCSQFHLMRQFKLMKCGTFAALLRESKAEISIRVDTVDLLS